MKKLETGVRAARSIFMRPCQPRNHAAWENRDPEDHFVYVMAHLNADNWIDAPTKVGISKDPNKRLKQVQADEPGKIVLLAQFGFWKRKHALAVEKAFHRVCEVYRIRGEWFDIPPMHVIGIMSHNLQAFAVDFLGADETFDLFSSYDHLNVPGALFDIDFEAFGHHQ